MSFATSCICLELRSLPSTRKYPVSAVLRTSPPPQSARPVPHGRPVGPVIPNLTTLGASRVARAFLCVRAAATTPVQRLARRRRSSHPAVYQPSPITLSGRPAHRPFRDLLSVHSRCGPHTRAVTYNVDLLHRRLQPFCYLHDCSGCFRLERLAGWGLHPLESAALSRRTRLADVADPDPVDASIGRIARLERSPRQGPECAPKPTFHRERDIRFTALSGSSNAPVRRGEAELRL